MVQQSTKEAPWRLCWYVEYDRSTPEAVPVQRSTIGALVLEHQITKGALGWLFWYSRVL